MNKGTVNGSTLKKVTDLSLVKTVQTYLYISPLSMVKDSNPLKKDRL